MHSCIIIPARYKSTRFSGKPLIHLLGKPMILWVAELSAIAVGKSNVYIATDDNRIKEEVERSGFKAVMTSNNALTGTDRIAEASDKIKADIYINVQGDEPLINPQDILKILDNKMKNIHNMNNMQNVDYDKIINTYGIEQDGSYVCNACIISIATTEILDLEDFTKGEDGVIIKTREIAKDIPIIEKQKDYINNIIKTLFEKDDKNKEVLKQRLNIFTLMK